MLITMLAVPPSASSADEPKIAPALAAEFEADSEGVDYWVTFDDQADLSGAADIEDWAERGQFVVDALQEAAERSQAKVRSELKAAGTDHESYWITNAIWVENGSQELAQELATTDQVEELVPSEEVELPDLIEPPEPVEPEADGSDMSVQNEARVEPGILNINADQVWAQEVRGEGIVVANIDTGVELRHPALVDAYRGNEFGGVFNHDYNWFDPTGAAAPVPTDGNGHGTHTMGTMVGEDLPEDLDQAGRVGVAPGARWIAARGCADSSCAGEDLAAASQWMLAPTRADGTGADPAKRPHIINNSWGRSGTQEPFLEDIQQAWAAAGIFGAWSNGNDGPSCGTAGSPGARIINYSVGAYSLGRARPGFRPPFDSIAEFSSRGPGQDGAIKPDIAAPGVNVISAWPTDFVSSGRPYKALSGTSMAAPHVSGAIALLWSADLGLIGDLEFTRQLLDDTAIDTPDDQCGGTDDDNNVYGEGRLDALALIDEIAVERGAVGGLLTDAETGEPVADAQVQVSGDVDRIQTVGSDGAYHFGLPPGEYDVEVVRYGYETASATVTVTSGETVTRDFALVPGGLATVTGRVVDDVGRPLYAALTIDGYPFGEVYTDPVTGHYSVDLPAGVSSGAEVDPIYPGYPTVPEPIEVGDDDTTRDFTIAADADACIAPGYAWHGTTTDFTEWDATTPGDGWDTSGRGVEWRFDNPLQRQHPMGSAGQFAIVDAADARGKTSATLTSPSFDLRGHAAPVLELGMRYLGADGQTGTIEYAVDDGDWTQIWSETIRRVDDRVSFELPEAADQASVQVRFTYEGRRGPRFWAIDDVFVGTRECRPVDGGMVVGEVTDGSTNPVPGTHVSLEDARDAAGQSYELRDPALDGAFYWLFGPTGEQHLTAARDGFASSTATVDITSDGVTRHDITMDPGQDDTADGAAFHDAVAPASPATADPADPATAAEVAAGSVGIGKEAGDDAASVAETQTVGLITGEQFRIDTMTDGTTQVEPVQHTMLPGVTDRMVHAEQAPGEEPVLTAVPPGVGPLVTSGAIDPNLFNLTHLRVNGYAESPTPITIHFSDADSAEAAAAAADALPGTKLMADSAEAGVATVSVTAEDASTFWEAVTVPQDRDAETAEDPTMPSDPMTTPRVLAPGIAGLSLDGAALDTAAPAPGPLYTLTVRIHAGDDPAHLGIFKSFVVGATNHFSTVDGTDDCVDPQCDTMELKFQVPAGVYLLQGDTLINTETLHRRVKFYEPEVHVNGHTVVDLGNVDRAVRVKPQVSQPTDFRVTNTTTLRERPDGTASAGLEFNWSTFDTAGAREKYYLPTQHPARTGTFNAVATYHLFEPQIVLDAAARSRRPLEVEPDDLGEGVRLEAEYSDRSFPSHQHGQRALAVLDRGEHTLDLVDAGHGTVEDFEGVDATGKLALIDPPPPSAGNLFPPEIMTRAHEAGAVAIVAPARVGHGNYTHHSEETDRIHDLLPIINVHVGAAALQERVADGQASVVATSTVSESVGEVENNYGSYFSAAPRYSYSLVTQFQGGVPTEIKEDFQDSELKAITARLHDSDNRELFVGKTASGPRNRIVAAASWLYDPIPEDKEITHHFGPVTADVDWTNSWALRPGVNGEPQWSASWRMNPRHDEATSVVEEMHARPLTVGPADPTVQFGEPRGALCNFCRVGDVLIPLVSTQSGATSHFTYSPWGRLGGAVLTDASGTEIPLVDAGNGVTKYDMPSETQRYTLTQSTADNERVWGFRSGTTTGGPPPGAHCSNYFDFSCGEAQPLIWLRYVAPVDLADTVKAGRTHTLQVQAYHQAPDAPDITEVTTEISFDGGETWEEARRRGRPGTEGFHDVRIKVPSLEETVGYASLRTTARDAEGNYTVQTTHHAFELRQGQRGGPPPGRGCRGVCPR